MKLYSKKEIYELNNSYEIEKYYCSKDGNYYIAIIGDKIIAKQYPGKNLYYILRRNYDI